MRRPRLAVVGATLSGCALLWWTVLHCIARTVWMLPGNVVILGGFGLFLASFAVNALILFRPGKANQHRIMERAVGLVSLPIAWSSCIPFMLWMRLPVR